MAPFKSDFEAVRRSFLEVEPKSCTLFGPQTLVGYGRPIPNSSPSGGSTPCSNSFRPTPSAARSPPAKSPGPLGSAPPTLWRSKRSLRSRPASRPSDSTSRSARSARQCRRGSGPSGRHARSSGTAPNSRGCLRPHPCQKSISCVGPLTQCVGGRFCLGWQTRSMRGGPLGFGSRPSMPCCIQSRHMSPA